MVTLTENAASAIRDLTQQAQAPDGSGLRITSEPDTGALRLDLAASPEQGDAVVDSEGAALFLDEGAASTLDGKRLDAQPTDDGHIQFTVTDTSP